MVSAAHRSGATHSPGDDRWLFASGGNPSAAGTHLAHTTAVGTNTNTVPIDDPYPFTDGLGMVPGDKVIIGSNPAVQILQVYGPNSGQFLYSAGYGLRNNTGTSVINGGYFTVSSSVTVSALSRRCYSGNRQTHLLGIGSGFSGSGAYLANGTTTVNMSGCTAFDWVTASLPSSVTLNPGTTYWMVSTESAGGDYWSDDYSVAVGSGIFNELGGVYGSSVASLNQNTTWPNGQYVGLNFTYTSSLPSNTLIVGTPVSFSSNANVDLADHNGSAPDLGAMEYSSTTPRISNIAPSSVSATSESASWNTGTAATSRCMWGLTSFYGSTSIPNTSLGNRR